MAATSARCVAGQCVAISDGPAWRQAALICATARSVATPPRGRASAFSQKFPLPSSGADAGATTGSAATATVMSATAPTVAPTKPRGVTPTIGTATPFSRSVRPTASG